MYNEQSEANLSYHPPTEHMGHMANHAAQAAFHTQPHPHTPTNDNNILLIITAPLLTLITQIRHTVDHPDVPGLRAQVIEELKNIEYRLTQIDCSVRNIIATRYCLCTAVDEAVLSRNWGNQSIWAQESLLSFFHKETWGGERFYIILEDMMKDIRKNIDFIELVYFLLSLGFEGKFFDKQFAAAREDIRNRMFYHIRNIRVKPEKILALDNQDSEWLIAGINKKSTLKRAALFTLALLITITIYFNYKVHNIAGPTLDKLNSIATVSPVTAFSQVIQRPIVMRDNN
ncbi:MAG: type IVB secretion system protein IcmH/DotU [Gammaproteobacteria bacterium]|nr:type IVB secretion system protein IcmH/DotU [Gammaproteobacteria bacterium]